MIVRQSGGTILVGVALGLGGAVASTRLLQTLLFGVAWNDAMTYAAVATGIFAIAMLACLLPAQRAARLDPLESLRGS
jgi:ABC-type antimicrobial peptide transport system permease subunit